MSPSYRNTTYCISKGCADKATCSLHLTDAVIKAAQTQGLSVSVKDYSDKQCFRPTKAAEDPYKYIEKLEKQRDRLSGYLTDLYRRAACGDLDDAKVAIRSIQEYLKWDC